MMDLWTEKYRPKELNEYVWRDPDQRSLVESWINQGSTPHVLFTGAPGSGKTSLAKLLLRQLKVQSGDILEINASRERKIDEVIPKILNFCTTWAIGNMKYVLLDEVDQFTPHSQRALRGEMEQYHESVRFILTCNYAHKIIPALHSRCQTLHFKELDLNEYLVRVADICANEGVAIETEEDLLILNDYVSGTHPDMRKCINLLQQNVVNGKLRPFSMENANTVVDWLVDAAALFKAGKFTDGRKLIVNSATLEEYEAVYRFLYQNLEIWGDDDAQNEALMIIRKGVVNHTTAADAEINLSATIAELCRIGK